MWRDQQFAQVSQFSEPFHFMCSRLNPSFHVIVRDLDAYRLPIVPGGGAAICLPLRAIHPTRLLG